METNLNMDTVNQSTAISVFQQDFDQEEAIVDSSDKKSIPYKLINIVALGILTKDEEPLKIDFERVKNLIDVKDVKRFPCIQFKVNGKSIILFKNGKIIFTGVKEMSTLYELKDAILPKLEEAKINFDEFDIEIKNLVIMVNLEKMINLEMACLSLENCLYEPEQFPAAIVKPKSGGTFLIFSNSKIIGLGLKSMEHVENSLVKMIEEIYDNEIFFEFSDEDLPDFDWDAFDVAL